MPDDHHDGHIFNRHVTAPAPATTMLEDLLQAVERLQAARPRSPWSPGAFLRIVEDPRLTLNIQRPLTIWERSLVWLEDLAARHDLAYELPVVRRSHTLPDPQIYITKGVAYCHPHTAQALRKRIETWAKSPTTRKP